MNERALRIKKLIEDSGKSYPELARITGISKSSLQRYATGVTTKIPLDVIDRLEKLFGVPRGYIMGWDANPSEAGAIAARVLKDPETFQFMKDFMELDEVDRYALRLAMETLKVKKAKKETNASALVVEVE